MLKQHHFDHPWRQASVRLLRRHHVLRFCQGPMLVVANDLGFVAQSTFVRAQDSQGRLASKLCRPLLACWIERESKAKSI